MNIQNVFRPLQAVEESLARLYRAFSEDFALDEEAAFLFFRMATEEKSHVALVRYGRSVVTQNPTLFGEVTPNLDEVRQMILEVESRLRAGVSMSLEEAVRLAMRFERSAAETHLRKALQESNPTLSRLLSALGGADRAHLEQLVAFAQRRGISLEGGVQP